MNDHVKKVLTAIAEGYTVTAFGDQYIIVENPNYVNGIDGLDPYLVLDMQEDLT